MFSVCAVARPSGGGQWDPGLADGAIHSLGHGDWVKNGHRMQVSPARPNPDPSLVMTGRETLFLSDREHSQTLTGCCWRTSPQGAERACRRTESMQSQPEIGDGEFPGSQSTWIQLDLKLSFLNMKATKALFGFSQVELEFYPL